MRCRGSSAISRPKASTSAFRARNRYGGRASGAERRRAARHHAPNPCCRCASRAAIVAFYRSKHNPGTFLVVLKDSPIEKLEDLKCKTIGAPSFGAGGGLAQSKSEQLGITPEQYTALSTVLGRPLSPRWGTSRWTRW